MDENCPIPEFADKMLFAEDLVKYVMKRIASVQVRSTKAGAYRKCIYNAFTRTAINAIENLELREQVDYEIDTLMREHGDLNMTIYDKFVREVHDLWFPSGFDPRYLLPFSAQIAHMAARFFIRGVTRIHKLATADIVSAFEEYDMKTGGWDILERYAERYATMDQGYQTLLQSERGVSRNIEERKIGEINAIAQNVEKTSFAKDLVYFVMHLNADSKIHPPCSVEEKYRNPIYNELTENTKEAIGYLSNTMECIGHDIDKLIHKHKFVNIDTFKEYASSIYNFYFSERFYAINFVPYCAHLASLATYFYTKGVLNAPEMAILDIEKICENFDTIPGGWNTLRKYADRYAFMARQDDSSSGNSEDQSDDDSDTNLLEDHQNSGAQD